MTPHWTPEWPGLQNPGSRRAAPRDKKLTQQVLEPWLQLQTLGGSFSFRADASLSCLGTC